MTINTKDAGDFWLHRCYSDNLSKVDVQAYLQQYPGQHGQEGRPRCFVIPRGY